MTMAPQSFVICNHSCPHSKSAMMKSNRANPLKLCYIFPYPPTGGIESHINSLSFHPFCSDACDAKNGPNFVNAGNDNSALQYWLPTLLMHSTRPLGYNFHGISEREGPIPGLWIEEDGNGVEGKYIAAFN